MVIGAGEALGDEKGSGINPEAIHDMARQIREVKEQGVEVVIVVGVNSSVSCALLPTSVGTTPGPLCSARSGVRGGSATSAARTSVRSSRRVTVTSGST